MATTTVPTFSSAIDQAFTDTFIRIKADVVDQVLRGTPLVAMLQLAGCFKGEVLGKFINRTVGYGQKSAAAVAEGDVITSETTELDTEAIWYPKIFAGAIQRTTYKDAENKGEQAVKNYVSRQLEAEIDALSQKLETDLLRAAAAGEARGSTYKEIQGLNDMIPVSASRASGTYGGINRPTQYTSDVPDTGNIWWSPKYKTAAGAAGIYLEADMRNLYNTISDNNSPPNAILTTQTVYEGFEESVSDRSQIVVGEKTPMAMLGFGEQFFKGASMTWSQNMTSGHLLMLNTAYIEFVYDTELWFQMGEWVSEVGTERRQASILCRGNLISDQLRRHGRLYSIT